MNVLLTCAGRRRNLVDYFRVELGEQDRILGVDMTCTAPALTGCDAYHLVPSVDDIKYIDVLLDICKSEKIDAVVSLNDLELPILSKAKSRFSKFGIQVIVSDEDVIDLCADKCKTFKFAESIKQPSPEPFVSLESVFRALKRQLISYPLVVKPRWGSASIGFYIAYNEAELQDAFYACQRILSNSFLSQLATDPDEVLVQEFIAGTEYGVDIFNDLNGVNRGIVIKKRLATRAGEADKALTVHIDKLHDYAKTLGNKLGHIGNLDCDFIERDGEFYLLEMNPRFGGGYPFTHEAGVNFIKALLQLIRGEDEHMSFDYKAGLSFAKYDVVVPVASA